MNAKTIIQEQGIISLAECSNLCGMDVAVLAKTIDSMVLQGTVEWLRPVNDRKETDPGYIFIRWRDKTDERCRWQINLFQPEAHKTSLSNESLIMV